MGRLFVLFFMLPWWVYVPASIGVYWLGERAYEQALETEADKAAALEAAPPEPIDIGAFDKERDIHAANEVNVIGLIDHDLDYELVESTNGVPTTTRYLYMIFGTNEFGAKEVRGALMLNKRDEAAFLDTKADEWAVDATADYWVYAFNGFATSSTKLSSMATEAIDEQGLTKAEDFIFIEPFFEGREAALAPRGVPEQTRHIGWAIAGLVALIGVVKRVMSVRARPARGAEEETDLTGGAAYAAAMTPEADPAFASADGDSDDTPIGRLARRTAPAMAPEEPQIYTGYRTIDPGYGVDDEPEYGDEPEYDDEYVYEEEYGMEPAQALAYESDEGDGYDAGYETESRFPPVPDDVVEPQPQPQRSSALAFYGKVLLGMIVVGGLAYDPSLLNAALPVAGVALFWFGLYIAFRRLRNGAKELLSGAKPARKQDGRPDGAAQPVAVGVGGHQIDLTAPVRSSRRERGVI